MTAADVNRSLIGKHTFTCALTTRGGVCDCWPVPEGSAPAGPAQSSAAASGPPVLILAEPLRPPAA